MVKAGTTAGWPTGKKVSKHRASSDERSSRDAGDQAHELLRQLARTPPGQPDRARLRAAAIEGWLPLAQQLARRYGGRGEPLADITQTATIGLIKAIDRFDGDRGSEFVAFAVPTIRGEIRRYFRDRTWDVRVPRRLQELLPTVRAAEENLAQRLGQAPSTAEVAADLAISTEEVGEARSAAQAYSAMSLDASVSPTGDAEPQLRETLGADDDELALVELRMTLAPALARLPEREQQILRLRFYENLTQTEIAQRIGVSQMHVSRLLARSLQLLRQVITEDW